MIHLQPTDDDCWLGTFEAMAGQCEVLFECDEESTARAWMDAVAGEALRIEHKFSRYRRDNVVHAINSAGGRAVKVDDETARLLNFADTCYEMSDGAFDITSGVLREAWQFDGSNRVPTDDAVAAVRARVGWKRVRWSAPRFKMDAGMEVDFGGIGKEYAVDRCVAVLRENGCTACLVNFGGDLRAVGPRRDGGGWTVGIEHASDDALPVISLTRGAIATSGDARRFILRDGVRYSHILDPRTGWPVSDAPHSVTVMSETCTQAGVFATVAMLRGRGAESYLERQRVMFWTQR